MPLLIPCPCGKKLKVRDELAGKKVKCPGCNTILVAPAPAEEPLDQLEVVEERKPEETAVSVPPPIALAKKKALPIDDEDDDDRDEEEEKPTPFWVFPGTLSTEVMALSRDGIWFDKLKGEALKTAEKSLKRGSHPSEVMTKKAWYIPWTSLNSIYCNWKRNGFTIAYQGGDAPVTKVITPADKESRNEIFEELEEYLKPDWERATKKHTPVTATLLPIVCIVIDFLVTIGLAVGAVYLAAGGEWEGRGRGAAVAALFNLLRWMGPLGTGIVGLVVAIMLTIWLMIRIINPPIEVTLKRAVRSEPEDDEDD